MAFTSVDMAAVSAAASGVSRRLADPTLPLPPPPPQKRCACLQRCAHKHLPSAARQDGTHGHDEVFTVVLLFECHPQVLPEQMMNFEAAYRMAAAVTLQGVGGMGGVHGEAQF